MNGEIWPMHEFDFIKWLRQVVTMKNGILLGPGDDTAILSLTASERGEQGLFTTDMLMEGTHFDLKKMSPELVGRKALAVNISDIAAMAGKPVGALISLALPKNGGADLGQKVFQGMFEVAEEFGVSIIGGDTNSWDGPLVISVALYGETTEGRAVLRSGARVGDVIFVTGELGGSLAGRHYTFQPRVKEALFLHEKYTLHAMIDLSDGLISDLEHILEESSCGAVLERGKIPISHAAQDAARKSGDPDQDASLKRALTDGEDFELCFTLPSDEASRLLKGPKPSSTKLSAIGVITDKPGLYWREADGSERPVASSWAGYQHEFV